MRHDLSARHALHFPYAGYTVFKSENPTQSSNHWGGLGVSTATHRDQPTSGFWKVQLWLGQHLLEEHIAPTALAQAYADVIRLRITGLAHRRLRCEPLDVHEAAYLADRPYDPRD